MGQRGQMDGRQFRLPAVVLGGVKVVLKKR